MGAAQELYFPSRCRPPGRPEPKSAVPAVGLRPGADRWSWRGRVPVLPAGRRESRALLRTPHPLLPRKARDKRPSEVTEVAQRQDKPRTEGAGPPGNQECRARACDTQSFVVRLQLGVLSPPHAPHPVVLPARSTPASGISAELAPREGVARAGRAGLSSRGMACPRGSLGLG